MAIYFIRKEYDVKVISRRVSHYPTEHDNPDPTRAQAKQKTQFGRGLDSTFWPVC